MRIRVVRASSGHEHVYLQEDYRDEQGRPRHRILEKYGRLADLEAIDPDALVKLQAKAKEMTVARAALGGQIGYDTTALSDGQTALNTGWWLAEACWNRLGLGPYLKRLGREQGWDVDVEAVARVLTCSRLIWPGSKRATTLKANQLAAAPGLELKDVYRALDHLAAASVRIQGKARRSLTGPGPGPGVVFYDVTNYFFAIDHNDPAPAGKNAPRGEASRQLGCSKEHRIDPIIQMGLFTDPAGIPLTFRLFDGNTPDSVTMGTALEDFKTACGAEHIIVVADKAMNNAANTATLTQTGDDWILSGSARATTKAIKNWMLDEEDWTWLDAEHTLKVKSTLITRTIPWVSDTGSPVRKDITEKIVARWSRDYAERDRFNRAEMLTKAQSLVDDPAAYRSSNRRGVKKYVTVEQADPATGEIQPNMPVLSLDQTRAAHDASLDGFWLIRTSLTGTPDTELLAHYHQLHLIEDCFKVTKTDLETRPVYVRTRPHIEAHFLICYLALLITKLLQAWTDLPTGQLLATLRDTRARHVQDGIYLLDRPASWDQIDTATGTSLNQKWASLHQLRDYHRALTTAAKERVTYTN